MNTGIIIGMVTSVVAILFNFLNLFGFKDFSTGTKEGIKIKHWRITYVVSWVIASMPFLGFIIEFCWFLQLLCSTKYRCTSKLFEEV